MYQFIFERRASGCSDVDRKYEHHGQVGDRFVGRYDPVSEFERKRSDSRLHWWVR
jgi:hypothetical protein